MKKILKELFSKFPEAVLEILTTGEIFPEKGKKEGAAHKSEFAVIWNPERKEILEVYARLISEKVKNQKLKEDFLPILRENSILYRKFHSKASAALFTSIAHKVNNKLTPVVAYAQLIMMKEGTKDIDKIQRNAREASELLNKTVGLFTPKKNEILNLIEISSILKEKIPGDWEKTGCYVDPFLFAIAIDEIKENGKRRGKIQGKCRKESKQVLIEIINQGKITPEAEKMAFEPFFSKDGREGIGLNLVHGIIVKIYGGSVNIEGLKNSTRVNIKIPCLKRNSLGEISSNLVLREIMEEALEKWDDKD